MKRAARAVSLVAAVLTAAACATTSFQSTWRAPEVGPLNFRGAKVAALVISGDKGFRLPAEDELARQITAQGAVGVAAYTLVPDDVIRDDTKSRALMEQAGVTGVVSMRVVSNEQRITSTPSSFWMGPPHAAFWGRPGWGRGYWGWGWGFAYAAPMIQTDRLVSVETLIFSLAQDKLVWVATSQTTNPSNVQGLVRELSRAAAGALRREGLIQRP
jgi:hypothetical protein